MIKEFTTSIKNKLKIYKSETIGLLFLLAMYLPQIIYPVLMQDGAIIPLASLKGYIIREFRPFTAIFGELDPKINLLLGTLFFYIFTNLMAKIFFKDINSRFFKTTFLCVSFLNIFMFHGRFWAPTFMAYNFTLTILILPFIWHGKIKKTIVLFTINLLAFFIGMISLQPQFLVAYFICLWLFTKHLEKNLTLKDFFKEYKYIIITLILATLLYIYCNLTVVNSARGSKILLSSFTMFVDRVNEFVVPIINPKSITFYMVLLNIVATIYFIYKSKLNKILATICYFTILALIVFSSFIPELLFGLKGTPVKNLQFYMLSVIYSYLFFSKINLTKLLKIAIVGFVVFGFMANMNNNFYAFKTMHLNLTYLRSVETRVKQIKQLKHIKFDNAIICTDPTIIKPSSTVFSFFNDLYFVANPYIYWPTTFAYYKISGLSAGSMGNPNIRRFKSKVKETGNPMHYKITLIKNNLYVY